MRTVRQEGENDCGVACVAMLADVTYAEAAAVIYPNGRSKLTKTKDLHRALKILGKKPLTERRQALGSKALTDLPHSALIFVEMDDGNASKHWVVWDAQARKVRDPYHKSHKHRYRGYLMVE